MSTVFRTDLGRLATIIHQSNTRTNVVQTRVRPENDAAFAAWQVEMGGIVAAFPGFVEQTVMQPSPPAQVDWVILQRFVNKDAASRGSIPSSGRNGSTRIG